MDLSLNISVYFILIIMIGLNIVAVEGFSSKFLIQDNEDIILSNSLYNSAPRDSFEIENIIIDGDLLAINVSYGGGCENHNFELIGSNDFAESYPVQTYVLLSHNAFNDSCEALIRTTLTFNLLPLAKKYLELYQTDSATLIIHIIGGLEPVSVNYYFEVIPTISDTTSTKIEATNFELYPFFISMIFLINRKKKCD